MEISIIPGFIIKKITSNSIQQINWNVLLSTLLLLNILIFVPRSFIDIIPHFCIFKKLIGIPCPGCGIIRSIYSLKNFKFLESFSLNPVGLFLVVFLLSQIPMRIIALCRRNWFQQINIITCRLSNLIISFSLIFWIIRIINLNF